ncbi:hypothetical protein D9M69_535240 [compost metagenome]
MDAEVHVFELERFRVQRHQFVGAILEQTNPVLRPLQIHRAFPQVLGSRSALIGGRQGEEGNDSLVDRAMARLDTGRHFVTFVGCRVR